MLVIGMTGSIATGKTTVARWLKELKIPVFEADAYVHELFTSDHEVIKSVKELWPHCIKNSVVDRPCLRKQVLTDREAILKLEAITHPKVRIGEEIFIKNWKDKGASVVVLDVPLLYESGQSELCDCILVVYCSPHIQKQRAIARGVSPSLLDYLTSLQIPLSEKLLKADLTLNTDETLDETYELLLNRLHEIESRYNVRILKDHHA